MLTWKLWSALNIAPRSPSWLQRLIGLPPEKASAHKPAHRALYTQSVFHVLAMAAFIFFVCSGGSLLLIPAAIVVMSGLTLPLILGLVGTLSGLNFSVKVSGAVAREKEKGRLELLSVTPQGALGLCWAICASYLERQRSISRGFGLIPRLYLFSALVLAVALLIQLANGLGLLMGDIPPNMGQMQQFQRSFMLTIYFLALLAGLFLDYAQSILVGNLIGMLAPRYTQRRLDAQAVALGTFLLLQAGSYLTLWLVGFVLLPGLYQALHVGSWLAELLLLIARLGIFYGLREGIIRILWRLLTVRLNARASEFAALQGAT